MSRTYRNSRARERSHERSECPMCQENLHHKHARKTPLFDEDEAFEPNRVLEDEDEDDGLEG